ncbi:EGF-like domain-containing protein [Caenorhabditis elegans]|uniref:EGF-like domain-containing protein n=1 Tax=Caenorhabditis elegans TaxID=6239 RepID=V6CLB5_CAEEL|nr:EGF-like domain-containing protein [Caenorhabditis elegans]CDK13355.1 EGF-like domain-containing protein [Caenorhabditis elegans]|eukprot:NP_001293703.1 Uncharacterized protein CELE_C01B10.6 [Caenorhabditis elegans]
MQQIRPNHQQTQVLYQHLQLLKMPVKNDSINTYNSQNALINM